MTTNNLTILKKCGYNIFAFGLPNVAINLCAAYGTRFIQHIPTQEFAPSTLAGIIFTVSCGLTHMVLQKTTKYYPDTKAGRRARTITYNNIQRLLATLVTTIGTPAVAPLVGRSISYTSAVSFALINCLSTLLVNDFFLHYNLTARDVIKS